MNPGASTRSPDLAEVIRNAIESALGEVYTSIPAKVVRYAGGRADCKPLVQRGYLDETDTRRAEALPVVPGCPVLFPGGCGFSLTFPISDGALVIEGQTQPATTGLLVVSTVSLDAWLTGSGQEVDPAVDHHHALLDAVFVPELRPFGAAGAAAPTDHPTLGDRGGVALHFHRSTICAGDESGADWVALAGKVGDALTALKDAISGAVVAQGDGGAALKANIIAALSGWPPALGASQLRAK